MRLKRVRNLLTVVLLLLPVGEFQQTSAGEDPWESYRFLLGEWEGMGSGKPGTGIGRFSFAFALKEKVLVRKNRAQYAAMADRQATVHEDLMVFYRSDGGKQVKAIYFDDEDHVIQYTASVSKDRQTLTFLSDESAAGPRFRLSYTKDKDDTVRIRFEIAPPGKPDVFKTYLEGTAQRRPSPK